MGFDHFCLYAGTAVNVFATVAVVVAAIGVALSAGSVVALVGFANISRTAGFSGRAAVNVFALVAVISATPGIGM
jgi:hypothetical protein